jgi:DNA-binding transcriptional LysR family regulator
VTPVLAKLQRCCADCQMELTSGDLFMVFQALQEDKIDLLLTNLADDADLRDYQTAVLQTKPALIVISVNHPWATRKQVTPSDLRLAPMLQFSRNGRTSGHSFYADLGNIAVKYVSDFDTMLATLENGQHFAVFPQSFDFRDRARFKYIELPEQFRFNYQTVLMAKSHLQKPKS